MRQLKIPKIQATTNMPNSGANLINFRGNVGTPTADMSTLKTLINSTISTKEEIFVTVDLKLFYLNTPTARFGYIKLPITILPQEIIDEYNPDEFFHNGFVYCKIRKGMYGLLQAGIISNQILIKCLTKHVYHPKKQRQDYGNIIPSPSLFPC